MQCIILSFILLAMVLLDAPTGLESGRRVADMEYLGGYHFIMQKSRPWIIVTIVFGACHSHCTLNIFIFRNKR